MNNDDEVKDPDILIESLKLPTYFYGFDSELYPLAAFFKKTIWNICNYSDESKVKRGLVSLKDFIKDINNSLELFVEKTELAIK